MPTASTPGEVHRLFAESFVAGDVDAVVSLYEPSATLLFQPGEEPARGTEAIRQALDGFLSMFSDQPTFDIEVGKVLQAGDDLALVISKWTMRGDGQDGEPLEMAGQTADVMRRQTDGSWRVAIDNPYGDAALA